MISENQILYTQLLEVKIKEKTQQSEISSLNEKNRSLENNQRINHSEKIEKLLESHRNHNDLLTSLKSKFTQFTGFSMKSEENTAFLLENQRGSFCSEILEEKLPEFEGKESIIIENMKESLNKNSNE